MEGGGRKHGVCEAASVGTFDVCTNPHIRISPELQLDSGGIENHRMYVLRIIADACLIHAR